MKIVGLILAAAVLATVLHAEEAVVVYDEPVAHEEP